MKNTLKTINKAVIAFLLLFVTSNLKAQDISDKRIVTVGNEIILESELKAQLMQLQQQGINLSDQVVCQVLDQMILQALLVNEAKLDSVVVSDDQIEAELNQKLNYFVQQFGSQQKLEDFYGAPMAIIKEDFREPIKNRILAETQKGTLMEGVSVTPSDVYNFYKKQNPDSLPLMPEQYVLKQIMIKPVISDGEIEALKAQLKVWRDEVAKGDKSIATIAVLYSDDKGTSVKGGKTGLQSRGTFVPEFEQVAYSLKTNEVSGVFKTEYGYHFMQLVERLGDLVNVAHVLKRPTPSMDAIIQAEKKADSLYQLLVQDTVSFETLVLKVSDDKATKNNQGLIQNPSDLSSKFTAELLYKMGYDALIMAVQNLGAGELYTQPILVNDPMEGQVFKIVKLERKIEAHKANLKEDFQLLNNLYKQQEELKVVNDWIRKKKFNTYIQIHEDYQNCDFQFGWTKK